MRVLRACNRCDMVSVGLPFSIPGKPSGFSPALAGLFLRPRAVQGRSRLVNLLDDVRSRPGGDGLSALQVRYLPELDRIDGTPRTYRDRKDYAMEAGRLIKSKSHLAGWSTTRGSRSGLSSDAYLRSGRSARLPNFQDAPAEHAPGKTLLKSRRSCPF